MCIRARKRAQGGPRLCNRDYAAAYVEADRQVCPACLSHYVTVVRCAFEYQKNGTARRAERTYAKMMQFESSRNDTPRRRCYCAFGRQRRILAQFYSTLAQSLRGGISCASFLSSRVISREERQNTRERTRNQFYLHLFESQFPNRFSNSITSSTIDVYIYDTITMHAT